jgi:hypothetical protein
MVSSRMREAHAEFLRERRQAIKSSPDGLSRRRFTSENPHICFHCNKIILGEPICIDKRECIPLGCSTSDAITAALDGCDFHQWIVDRRLGDFKENGTLEYLEEPLWIRLPNRDPESPWAAVGYADFAMGSPPGGTALIPCQRFNEASIFVCSRHGMEPQTRRMSHTISKI